MIIHKKLKTFLEFIYKKDLDFSSIHESDLRREFKNNEYYQLKNFCLENKLIVIEFHEVNLTGIGLDFVNILKKITKY